MPASQDQIWCFLGIMILSSGYALRMLTTILLLLGFICFVLAAFGVAITRVNLVALGLALWILVPLCAALGVG